ncbi:MAG: hypothetical protein AAF289_01805 [Cyanobacteria bacterium P01_A01_bin.135]
MPTVQHYATNYLENVKVTLIPSSQTLAASAVEYCIASGYVKITPADGRTLITHISNVVIEMEP